MKKSQCAGTGWSIFKTLLLFLLGGYSAGVLGQISSIDSDPAWTESSEWPYALTIQTGHESVLVVLEQRGLDLGINRPDNIYSDGSSGRTGPEFVLLEPNVETTLFISPVHTHVANGKFRIHKYNVSDPSYLDMAKEFDRAGVEFGFYSREYTLSACSRYESISSIEKLAEDWKKIASLLLVQCNLQAGIPNSSAQLDRMLEYFSEELKPTFSLHTYHSNWLVARHFYTLQEYEEAEVEFEKAVTNNLAYSNVLSDKQEYLQLDRAEILSQYGDNGMMLSWKLGNGVGKKLLGESQSRVEAAIKIGEEFQDSQILGNAYSNLAGVLFVQGENIRNIDHLKQAEKHLALAGDVVGQNSVLGNIGDYYRRHGQLRLAQNAYNKAIANINTVSDVGNHGYLYRKLGDLALLFMDFDSAQEYTLRAIAHHDSEGRERSKYESISQLASIHREQGNYREALANRRKALEFFENNDWTVSLLTAKANYSHDLRLAGEPGLALEYSTQVLNQLATDNSDAGIDRIAIYTNHAKILLDLGLSEESITQLDAALTELETNGAEPIDEITLLATLADVYQNLGDTPRAIEVSESVFALIESQRVEFDSVRLGPLWSARTSEIYLSHIEYLLQQGDPDLNARAFQVSERASAVSLRQRRQEMLQSLITDNPEAWAEWVAISSQLETFAQQPSQESNLLQAERELNNARQRYFAAHGLSNTWQKPEILRSEDLIAAMPSDTQFIKYVAGPKKLWRFSMRGNLLEVKNLGERGDVSTKLKDALASFKDSSNGDRSAIREASDLLLADVAIKPSTSNLLISSNSLQVTIPFSALFDDTGFLVDATTITMVPSFSEYFGSTSQPSIDEQLEIAVIADPAFDGNKVQIESEDEGFSSWLGARERLPFSAIEAQELARYFNSNERLILTDSEATESRFFSEEVRNAKILHIATHGYFNEAVPDLVGLSLANDEQGGNGFVSLAEISMRSFYSNLVVISACDTANGSAISGEGALSLSRAFLAQGVDSVVSTLWPVADAATALFMKEFYRGIRAEGLTYAEALQFAQHALKRNPRYRDPFYWGAYVLSSLSEQRVH